MFHNLNFVGSESTGVDGYRKSDLEHARVRDIVCQMSEIQYAKHKLNRERESIVSHNVSEIYCDRMSDTEYVRDKMCLTYIV